MAVTREKKQQQQKHTRQFMEERGNKQNGKTKTISEDLVDGAKSRNERQNQ